MNKIWDIVEIFSETLEETCEIYLRRNISEAGKENILLLFFFPEKRREEKRREEKRREEKRREDYWKEDLFNSMPH